MKILIIGVGGIGSWLVREVADCVMQEQIETDVEFTIADDDLVEIKNIKYQNFKDEDVGESKVGCLAHGYDNLAWITPLRERITTAEQLKKYNLIIICADNVPVRELVFRYCHENSINFIDLRSEGRMIMAFQKSENLQEDLDTLDLKDKESSSCQKPYEFQKGIIQKGNKIVAMVGIQMLLNYLRGERNNKILVRI